MGLGLGLCLGLRVELGLVFRLCRVWGGGWGWGGSAGACRDALRSGGLRGLWDHPAGRALPGQRGGGPQ